MLPFATYRKGFGVVPGIQRLQEPADRSGRPDADTDRQGQRNTAGPGHSVQFSTQDPRPHPKGQSNSLTVNYY